MVVAQPVMPAAMAVGLVGPVQVQRRADVGGSVDVAGPADQVRVSDPLLTRVDGMPEFEPAGAFSTPVPCGDKEDPVDTPR